MIVHRDYRDSGNYSSSARNRAIARAFKEAGIIERYGSGIKRIKDECSLHGIVEPKFEEFVHGFRVTVYKEKLNEGVKSLYELIKSKPNNRSIFFAKELSTSVKNIERWLKQLKDENKIEFKGSPKTGGYFGKKNV